MLRKWNVDVIVLCLCTTRCGGLWRLCYSACSEFLARGENTETSAIFKMAVSTNLF